MTLPTGRPVDLDAVAQLVEQLERDLARARTGGASVETLQAEVEQLRAALAAGSPSSDDVSQSLVSVRSRLHDLGDELGKDAFIGADYLARIGRLLGLT
jgi:cell division septum initiation protein DivIVA